MAIRFICIIGYFYIMIGVIFMPAIMSDENNKKTLSIICHLIFWPFYIIKSYIIILLNKIFNKIKEKPNVVSKKMHKVKFDYKTWLSNPDQKVVDEDGNDVEFYYFNNTWLVSHYGKLYKPEEIPLYFYTDIYNTDYIKNTRVSADGSNFYYNSTDEEKRDVVECFVLTLQLVTEYSKYGFFKQKLWSKISGFEDKSETEIKMAFLYWRLRYEYGLQCTPIADSDAPIEFTGYNENDDTFNNYIMQYAPVFNAFTNWLHNNGIFLPFHNVIIE